MSELVQRIIRAWYWMLGEVRVRDMPIGEWVQVDENTRVKRWPDNSVEFQSTLNAEHPTATWTWR